MSIEVSTHQIIIDEKGKKLGLYAGFGLKKTSESFVDPESRGDKLIELFNRDMKIAKKNVSISQSTNGVLKGGIYESKNADIKYDAGRYLSKYQKYFSKELLSYVKDLWGKNWEYTKVYSVLSIGGFCSSWENYNITDMSIATARKLVDENSVFYTSDNIEKYGNTPNKSFANMWIEHSRIKPSKKFSMSAVKTIILSEKAHQLALKLANSTKPKQSKVPKNS